jgi:hypothetical protein
MIIKTKKFHKWAQKAGLADVALCQAVVEMLAGLIDADLGGGVVKKRVALPGKGKSGGVRTFLRRTTAQIFQQKNLKLFNCSLMICWV